VPAHAAETPAPEPVSPADARAAIARGVAYLVDAQNEDGSWGSPAPALFLDIYSPHPGSHYAYQVASSALALSALLEVGDGLPGVDDAVRRAADWLLEHHDIRRVNTRVLYNNWGHAYALEAFARLLATDEKDEARRAKYRAAAAVAVRLLERYEYVDGGWGYYDFSVGSRTPAHGQATSFTTATVLQALAMAKAQGIEVPDRIVDRGRKLLRICRLPGGAYAYSFGRKYFVPRGVNKPEGSAARTPACHAALLASGERVPTKLLVQGLDNLETYGHFLRIARKYPRPHESWYQNSGYFCFYGYYYASFVLGHVPEAKRSEHAALISAHLVPLQEKDGSWWDYQLFRFHKAYGTGYVLMALGRALAILEADASS
jgi:hypothetical protein